MMVMSIFLMYILHLQQACAEGWWMVTRSIPFDLVKEMHEHEFDDTV